MPLWHGTGGRHFMAVWKEGWAFMCDQNRVASPKPEADIVESVLAGNMVQCPACGVSVFLTDAENLYDREFIELPF